MRAATASAWALPLGCEVQPRGPFPQDLARRGRHTVAHEEHHGRTGVSDLWLPDFLARRENRSPRDALTRRGRGSRSGHGATCRSSVAAPTRAQGGAGRP